MVNNKDINIKQGIDNITDVKIENDQVYIKYKLSNLIIIDDPEYNKDDVWVTLKEFMICFSQVSEWHERNINRLICVKNHLIYKIKELSEEFKEEELWPMVK